MPRTSGVDLVAKLRDMQSDLPVLYISGFPHEELDDWETNGHTMFLAKPFRGEEIVERASLLTHPQRKVSTDP